VAFDGLKFHRASVRYGRMRRTYRFQRWRSMPRRSFRKNLRQKFDISRITQIYLYIYAIVYDALTHFLRIILWATIDTAGSGLQHPRRDNCRRERSLVCIYVTASDSAFSAHIYLATPLFFYTCILALVNFLCKRFLSDSHVSFWRAFSIAG